LELRRDRVRGRLRVETAAAANDEAATFELGNVRSACVARGNQSLDLEASKSASKKAPSYVALALSIQVALEVI
jgi:hypothetical protein